ncbi:MAG: LON peptidase substrate-binding domain-containing protein [Pseudomonadota bacterium]
MSSISLFPLNTVLFPDGYLPLQVFEVRYLDLVKKCIANSEEFGVVALAAGDEVQRPEQKEELTTVGTMAKIVDWTAPQPGLLQITCVGTRRFRIETAAQLKHGLWTAEVEMLEPDMDVAVPSDQQDVANALGSVIRSLQKRQLPGNQMPMLPPYKLDDCGWVSNRWCELLRLEQGQKQLLLAQQNPVLRLELIQDVLSENGLLG